MIQSLLHLYSAAPEAGGRSQFEFEIAKDGYEAIEKLAGPLPDLILLDLRLPGVGGMVVLDAIRKVDAILPVIVISAYGDKPTRREAAARGANDFYQKPVNAMRLFRRIRELVATTSTLRPPAQTPAHSGGQPSHRDTRFDTIKVDGQHAELMAKHRRLYKLRERQALFGTSAPPELLIEIEDLEFEIEGLEDSHSHDKAR
jgi:DNA-binding response OmpR family regulator